MEFSTVLDPGEPLAIASVRMDASAIHVRAKTVKSAAARPHCGALSRRVHSHYLRHVDDLPWDQRAVRLQLEVRRFFCDDFHCERKVFAVRMPEWLAAWARRTLRLKAVLRLLYMLAEPRRVHDGVRRACTASKQASTSRTYTTIRDMTQSRSART